MDQSRSNIRPRLEDLSGQAWLDEMVLRAILRNQGQTIQELPRSHEATEPQANEQSTPAGQASDSQTTLEKATKAQSDAAPRDHLREARERLNAARGLALSTLSDDVTTTKTSSTSNAKPKKKSPDALPKDAIRLPLTRDKMDEDFMLMGFSEEQIARMHEYLEPVIDAVAQIIVPDEQRKKKTTSKSSAKGTKKRPRQDEEEQSDEAEEKPPAKRTKKRSRQDEEPGNDAEEAHEDSQHVGGSAGLLFQSEESVNKGKKRHAAPEDDTGRQVKRVRFSDMADTQVQAPRDQPAPLQPSDLLLQAFQPPPQPQSMSSVVPENETGRSKKRVAHDEEDGSAREKAVDEPGNDADLTVKEGEGDNAISAEQGVTGQDSTPAPIQRKAQSKKVSKSTKIKAEPAPRLNKKRTHDDNGAADEDEESKQSAKRQKTKQPTAVEGTRKSTRTRKPNNRYV